MVWESLVGKPFSYFLAVFWNDIEQSVNIINFVGPHYFTAPSAKASTVKSARKEESNLTEEKLQKQDTVIEDGTFLPPIGNK